jgi:hypothetical protein
MRRVRFALLASLGLLVAGQPGGAQSPAGGWRLVRVRASLLGTHHWYQQTHRGVDVLGGVRIRHVYEAGDVIVRDRGRALGRDVGVTPRVAASAARAAAGPFARDASLAIQPGGDPRLVWAVVSTPPTGSVRTLVDAQSGAVVSVERLAREFDGTGVVFDPNPVVTLRDPELRDQDDADYPELAGAYQTVTLRHLDGSGFLRGDYADARGAATRAFSSTLSFLFGRSSPGFEETMAYYHVTASQDYIQSLGFAGPTAVGATSVELVANALREDSSFYDPATRTIALGSGGVDDGEDADIINHEYGHAIHDDVIPGFGTSADARAIGEGLSDYWAITMSEPVNGGYDVPCMGDWDASTDWQPPGAQCLIRTDTDTRVADRNGEPHHDGMIWSRAMWDVHQALGRDLATTIMLESLFAFTPDVTFEEGAAAATDTARRLFGNAAARVVTRAFEARGIGGKRGGQHPSRPHPTWTGQGFREIARTFAPAPGGGAYDAIFEPYALSEGGAALFAADVSTGGQAIFTAERATVSQVARSFEPAPGGGTYGLGVLPGPGLSASGEVAFAYVLDPFTRPFGRNSGVYRWSRGVARPIVVPDQTPAPGGGVFVGAVDKTGVNAAGAVAFSGMIETTLGIAGTLGVGVYLASGAGEITTVAQPGSQAPGGGVFDYASEPAINDAGDVAFTGHLAGTPCLVTIPQSLGIGCVRDLFVREGASGDIRRIAGLGDAAPGGGSFRDIRYPVLNRRGDVLFRAVIDTEDGGRVTGYFLSRGGQVLSVARAGDPMPEGGSFVAAAGQPGNWDLNERGEVTFSATLDTVQEDWGLDDQGLYRWSDGVLSVVTRTGHVLPAGPVIALQPLLLLGGSAPFSGAALNGRGQVLFQATVMLSDGFLDTVVYVSQ